MALGILLLLLCTGALATLTAETQDAVDDSNKTLKTIPKDLPKNITKLILSNNFIELSGSDMDALSAYQTLTELTLDSNLITTLPDNLTAILPQLRILNLSHNNISVLNPKALSGQASLTDLDLSHNLIASLPPQLFIGLPGLKRIHLQSNKLQTLEKAAGLAPESLEQLSLEDNPWECSCDFVSLMKWMNSSGLLIPTQATCLTPQELLGKSIVDDHVFLACSLTSTQAPTSTVSTRSTTTLTSTQSSTPTKGSSDSHSSKDSVGNEGAGSSGGALSVGNTWKLLVGVVVIALSTSVVIVCAVKSPSWYKLLFNYRHQRLREEGGPNVMATGRYSNFSLETEQTETSAHELEEGLDCDMQDEEEEEMEDEDGFIEDRYIETGDYKDQNES